MTKKSKDFRAQAHRAQAAYDSATALGQQLETVTAGRPPAVEFEAAAKLHLSTEIRSLTTNLFETRKNGSKFLSDEEWETLRRHTPFWPETDLVTQCQILRTPWSLGTPAQRSRIVLFDTRVLQPALTNGTKNHALALLESFLTQIPQGYEVAFLTAPYLPDLAPDIARRATVTWRPALIGDVDLFVQLATISYASDPANLDLLRAPWIKRISVFLDDIQGLYPAHYAGTELLFWLHQLAIEKLRRSEVVLTLGHTSQKEAVALWTSIDRDEQQPVFMSTSCLTSIPVTEKTRGQVAAKELLVFGNYHPHKNVALAAVAVGPGRDLLSGHPKFTFLADLSTAQRNAIIDAADSASGHSQKDGIEFAAGLSDTALARRIQDSRAVIIPSLHEGFSIPVIEAIALGAPVLLSRIDAHQELLPEGPWFFDPTNVESLLASIAELELNGDSWVEEQREGLSRNYSPEKMTRVILDALDIVLGSDVPLRHASAGARQVDSPDHTGTSNVTPSVVNRDELAARDSAFVSATLAMLDPESANYPLLNTPLRLFKNEHDNIVAEFHASTTWRVGKAVTAPIHWLQRLRAWRPRR